MLNSRATLVTEPCNHIHTNTIAGTPSTKDTGLICRIPLDGLVLHVLGFSPRGTSAGSGYGYIQSIHLPFSWTPGICEMDHRPTILKFTQDLTITVLL